MNFPCTTSLERDRQVVSSAGHRAPPGEGYPVPVHMVPPRRAPGPAAVRQGRALLHTLTLPDNVVWEAPSLALTTTFYFVHPVGFPLVSIHILPRLPWLL